MSATSPCIPCCPTPQSVNVPGAPGGNGTNGTNGVNAFTLTAADFTVPAIGGSVTVTVANSTWMVIGQILIMTGPANFLITAIPSTTTVTLTFLGYPGDVAPAVAILTGTKVSPAGLRGGSTFLYTSTAANLSLTDFMDVIEVTADNKTITLPTAIGRTGKVFTVKQSAVYASGTLVNTTGGQTIDGSATKTIAVTNGFAIVVSNGSNWLLLANKLT
jgi:hypothetical protein